MKIILFAIFVLGLSFAQIRSYAAIIKCSDVHNSIKTYGKKLKPTQVKQISALIGNYLKSMESFREAGQILSIADTGPFPLERELFNLLDKLNKSNRLESGIDLILSHPLVVSKLEGLSEGKREALKSVVKTGILAQVNLLSSPDYLPWSKLVERNIKLAKEIIELSKDDMGHFRMERFKSVLAEKFETRFVPTKEFKILLDPVESFQLRKKLIKESKKIDVFVWGVYDDLTGTEMSDLLIEAHKNKTQVRVVVDGEVAKSKNKSKNLGRLRDEGIEVIFSVTGMHRKLMIFDENKIIAGGRNWGDAYSGLNPLVPAWTDTDFYADGEIATQAQSVFNRDWNRLIDAMNLPYTKVLQTQIQDPAKSYGDIAVFDQAIQTNNPYNDTVLLMAHILAAESELYIANAYIVLTPDILWAIQQAHNKKVEIYALSNSPSSVDEPVVSLAILNSLKTLAKMGVKVFLREGTTLHAKYLVVDGMMYRNGSGNIHPRSLRVESEISFTNTVPSVVERARQGFYIDISPENATFLSDPDSIEIPVNASSVLPLRLFFDLL